MLSILPFPIQYMNTPVSVDALGLLIETAAGELGHVEYTNAFRAGADWRLAAFAGKGTIGREPVESWT